MNDKKHVVAVSLLVTFGLSLSPVLGFLDNCFHRRTLHVAQTKKYRSGSALNYRVTSEDEAVTVLLNARDCAYSSSCTLEEAKSYLEAVTHVQLGCATGHPISADACEDPLFLIELSHELKNKIKSMSEQSSSKFNALDAKLSSEKKLVKFQDYRAAVAFSRVLASIFGLILIYAIVSLPSLIHNIDNSKPFTMEEWGYAVKDGYLPLMVMHYIRNGGL